MASLCLLTAIKRTISVSVSPVEKWSSFRGILVHVQRKGKEGKGWKHRDNVAEKLHIRIVATLPTAITSLSMTGAFHFSLTSVSVKLLSQTQVEQNWNCLGGFSFLFSVTVRHVWLIEITVYNPKCRFEVNNIFLYPHDLSQADQINHFISISRG